ncbi:MAG: GntR family transcriptional regulator [Anaerolineales bacterium]
MPATIKNLHKVSRKLIYEDVLSILRAAILEGAFEIGEHLVETDIAEQLETSRVPVREAFKELAREKLIELHPFKGAVVASFAATDIHEIYTLRGLLEGFAARLVAKQATLDELAQLQEIHDEIEILIEKNDLGPVPQKDFEFHREICRLSGNERLLEIWDALASQVRLVIAMADEIFLETYSILEVHRPVMEALINRDPVGAEEAMAINLRKVAQMVARALEDRDTG